MNSNIKPLKPTLYLNRIIDSSLVYGYIKLLTINKYSKKLLDAFYLLYLIQGNQNNPPTLRKVFNKEIFNSIAKNNDMGYLTTPFTYESKKFEHVFCLFDDIVNLLKSYSKDEQFLIKIDNEFYAFIDERFEGWLGRRFTKHIGSNRKIPFYSLHPGLFKLFVNKKSIAYFKTFHRRNWFTTFFLAAGFSVPFGASFINQKYFKIPFTNNLFLIFMGLQQPRKSNKWRLLKEIYEFEKELQFTELPPESKLKKELFPGYEHFDNMKINENYYLHLQGYSIKVNINPKKKLSQLFQRQLKICPLAFQYFLALAKANYTDWVASGYRKESWSKYKTQHFGKYVYDSDIYKVNKHILEQQTILTWLGYSDDPFLGGCQYRKRFPISKQSAFKRLIKWPVKLNSPIQERAFVNVNSENEDAHYRSSKKADFIINLYYLKKKRRLQKRLFKFYKEHIQPFFEVIQQSFSVETPKKLYAEKFKDGFIITPWHKTNDTLAEITYTDEKSFWKGFNSLVWKITNVVFAQSLYQQLNIQPVVYNINW